MEHPEMVSETEANAAASHAPAQDVLLWVFRQVDKMPHNDRISLKEASSFSHYISLNVGPRACAMSLFEHMDSNQDGDVSLLEWFASMGVELPGMDNHGDGQTVFVNCKWGKCLSIQSKNTSVWPHVPIVFQYY